MYEAKVGERQRMFVLVLLLLGRVFFCWKKRGRGICKKEKRKSQNEKKRKREKRKMKRERERERERDFGWRHYESKMKE